MRVVKTFDNSYVGMNVLNHNKTDFGSNTFLKINNCVIYPSVPIESHPHGTIGLNKFVRSHLNITLNEIVQAEKIKVSNLVKLTKLSVKIVPHVLQAPRRLVPRSAAQPSDGWRATPEESLQPTVGVWAEPIVSISLSQPLHVINLHEDSIRTSFVKYFENYYLCSNQCLYFEMENTKLIVYVLGDVSGYCDNNTKIDFTTDDVSLNIIGSKLMKKELFDSNYNFEKIGIGGLNKQLVDVLRRCLSTRAYKPDVIDKLGVKHVKGMLLYGPPGCGKTLIARKIGALITNKKPKIVNGPEIMNKYVGESEKNIRELFTDAFCDQDELHVIIFDEIDAICKKRQNGGTSFVSDSVVNQLLTMIDGYSILNNIFIIGMTNRIDLLDEALLRAGRLEVHIEVGLPDKQGRMEIFRIHTNKMVTNGMVEGLDVDLFSEMTENYSGAEIESVVRNAVSRSLHEGLTVDTETDNVIVRKHHFLQAIQEINPMFGKIQKEVASLIPKNFDFISDAHQECYHNILQILQNTNTSTGKRINTFLISGENKCGKTVLALKIAFDSQIKNIKVIRAIDLISFDELGKANYISDLIKNAYMSSDSLIVIDDIEIAINYAQMGNNTFFSNRLYQIIITILKTEPIHPEHKISFICTSRTNEIFSETKLFDLTSNISII